METDSLFWFIAIAVATGSILLPLSIAAAIGYAKKNRSSGGGGSTSTPPVTPTTPTPPSSSRGGNKLVRWAWRIFWILVIVGVGLFVADNFTYLKGQAESLWTSRMAAPGSAPSAPAPSVPAPTAPSTAAPTSPSSTPATGPSTDWTQDVKNWVRTNVQISSSNLVWLLGLPLVLIIAWRYYKPGKGFWTGTGILLSGLFVLGYFTWLMDNGFNRYGSASAASAPGTRPVAEIMAEEAYTFPCNLNKPVTLELKKGNVVRNDYDCDIGARVLENRVTGTQVATTSEILMRVKGRAPQLLNPNSSGCNDKSCSAPEAFEAVSDRARIKMIFCPKGKWVEREFACYK